MPQIVVDCETFLGKYVYRDEEGRKRLSLDELDGLRKHREECCSCDSEANNNGLYENQKLWSKKDILKMWPQAAEELRRFQRALNKAQAGKTASQLGMALQLADTEFQKLLNDNL